MPPDPADALRDSDPLRHDLCSPLTVIHAQAQLLQRRAHRMDGMSAADRARLEAGLTVIQVSAKALVVSLIQLPGSAENTEKS